MKWFHKPSGRLMVATPTLRDELVEHGFKNVSPWSRGVDTKVFNPDLEPIYDELGGKDWPRLLKKATARRMTRRVGNRWNEL